MTIAPAAPPRRAAEEDLARLREYALRLVREAFGASCARGTVASDVGGCLDAHDFASALAQMIRRTIPDGYLFHDLDSCPCIACAFYDAYPWDSMPDAVLTVAAPAATPPAPVMAVPDPCSCCPQNL
jgi:hypothetical protein